MGGERMISMLREGSFSERGIINGSAITLTCTKSYKVPQEHTSFGGSSEMKDEIEVNIGNSYSKL